MNDLLVFLGWAYANLPAIVTAAVLFGLVTVYADRHPGGSVGGSVVPMTAVLLPLAVLATLADAAAFTLLILPGHASEANPLIVAMPPAAALWAKAGLIVLLAFLVAVSDRRIVRLALGTAIVVGTAGAASTVLA